MELIRNLLRNLLIGVIRLYQSIAPARIRQSCRYEPTCSTYMIMAIQKYGLRKGVGMGVDRIKRCKIPYGGVDIPR